MKRFKCFFMALVLVTGLLGASFSSAAEASSYSTGKAVIPMFTQTTYTKTIFSVSNITDDPISVTVTFYRSDGSILTDNNSSTTGLLTASAELLDYKDQNTDSSATFTLAAHNTGYIRTDTVSAISNFGYGIIKWEQDGTILQGLIVNGYRYYTLTESYFAIPVNSGMPF